VDRLLDWLTSTPYPLNERKHPDTAMIVTSTVPEQPAPPGEEAK
jgi:hypothetical protein